MENVWTLAALWAGLELIATLLAISTALSEKVAETVAQFSLIFGTIFCLFGLNHGLINQAQYSFLFATVIGSAVVPTLIANAFFMPKHLLRQCELEQSAVSAKVTAEALEGGDL